jgi:hypothetical protein
VLSDFDLSASEHGTSMHVTVAHTTRAGPGTAGYMAPEVVEGKRATFASDIYSFGVCALAALAVGDETLRCVLSGHASATEAALVLGEPALVAALSAEPSQRPDAAELAGCALFAASDVALHSDAAARGARARDSWRACAVCFDERIDEQNGTLCSAGAEAERHFVCDECLSAHVHASCKAAALGAFADAIGRVHCVRSAPAAGGCAHAYNVVSLAPHVPREVLTAFWRARRLLDEQRIAADLEEGVERRIAERVAALVQLTESERRQREVKAHTCERILTLACPRCGAAFAEALDGDLGFTGCCALTCARPGCAAAFCAYCLEDCGGNAHQHVARCLHGSGTHVQRDVFEEKQRARRTRMLRAFLERAFGAGEANSHDSAVVDVAIELRGLGLDPAAFFAAAH